MRQTVGLFFFFGLAGTMCDRSWVVSNIMRYPLTHHLQPWWIFLQLGGVGVVAVLVAAWLTNLLVRRDTPVPADPAARFAGSASLFVAGYIACGLFDASRGTQLAWGFIALWLVRLILQRLKGFELVAVLLITIGLGAAGVIAEIVLTHLHVMEYARPAFFGVPYWLAGLYMQAGYLARDIARLWFGGR